MSRIRCGLCCTRFTRIGNAIGTYFIDLAQKEMQDQLETLPSRDLAYFMEGTEYFDDYLKAVAWAQLLPALTAMQ